MVVEWINVVNTVINPLDEQGYSVLNIVDVGVNRGQLKQMFDGYCQTPTYFIGIEPNKDLKQASEYDIMFNYAVDNVESPTTGTFYINKDTDCSSLLEMNEDILTYDVNEKHNKDKWFVSRPINIITEERQVPIAGMDFLLDQVSKLQDEFIHLVKIDVQGVDVRVVESMKKYLDKTIFIMIELATSENEDVVLYKGQTVAKNDIEVLKKLGFVPYYTVTYADTTPEVDMIFINEKYTKNE